MANSFQTYYSIQHDPDASFQCRHIHIDGRRCGSPCLRNEPFCYFHHTTRRPVAPAEQAARKGRRAQSSTFVFPQPEDRSAIQLALGDVLQRIASNEIDPRRAGLLLYGLQIASLNLPKPVRGAMAPTIVEDIIQDPTHGTLAPIGRIGIEEAYTGPAARFFLKLEREKAEREQQKRELEAKKEAEARDQADRDQRAAEASQSAAAILPTLQAVAAASAPCPPLRIPAKSAILRCSVTEVRPAVSILTSTSHPRSSGGNPEQQIDLLRGCTPVLMIRLARVGARKQPHYRVVVIEKDRARNGRSVEVVGTYNPRTQPATVDFKRDRVDYWTSQGAQLSETVGKLFAKHKPTEAVAEPEAVPVA